MSGFELSKESATAIKAARGEFGKASVALVTACAGIGLALQIERINALAIPAARRPKLAEIKEAIRAEFGGLEKEANRQAYDLCSLAFRVLAKVDKEGESIVQEAPGKGAAWFRDQISALAGRATVDAWKAWVMGEKAKPAEKSPGERALAYVEKHLTEIDPAALRELSDMMTAEIARRARIEAEIAKRNAS